jgi:hypothetical protein
MATLKKHAKDFFDWVKHRPTQVTAYISIEADHVEDESGSSSNFVAGQHYFRAVVSEMFLADSRKWFREYDPIVYSAVEFNYGSSQQEEPKVIGILPLPSFYTGRRNPITSTICWAWLKK